MVKKVSCFLLVVSFCMMLFAIQGNYTAKKTNELKESIRLLENKVRIQKQQINILKGDKIPFVWIDYED